MSRTLAQRLITRVELALAYARGAIQGLTFVNVKLFGAVGNGVHDDTAAIRAALAANPGNTIFFPPGTYKVTAAITIPTATTLLGALAQDVNATSGSIISFQGPGASFLLPAICNDVTIQNLAFLTDATAGPCIGTAPGCIATAIAFRTLKFVLGNPAKGAIEFGSYASPSQIAPAVLDSIAVTAAKGQSVPLIGMWGTAGGLNNITFSGRSVLTSPTVANNGTLLAGTFHVINGNAAVTASQNQTLLNGQLIQFQGDPVVYEVAAAVTASTAITLTQAYFGVTGVGANGLAVAEQLHVEAVDNNTITNLDISGIVSEIPYTGFLKLRGVRNSQINSCWSGDLSPTAPIYDIIFISKSTAAGSPPTLNITINNFEADSGVQNAATIFNGEVASIQSINVIDSTIPFVQDVPKGGPYTPNQGFIPVSFTGSLLGGFAGDQPTGVALATLGRFWTLAVAPEPMVLANGVNSNVTGTGNLRGAYRITGPTAPFTIDGVQILTWGANPIDGVEIDFINTTAQVMTIGDASGSASAAPFQILCPGGANVALAAGPSMFTLKYDLTSAKFRLKSHT